MKLIKTFEQINKDDVMSVGGKGANLGEMVSAGIAVPYGFVVTSDAYRMFLKENNLGELFSNTIKQAGNDSEKLRSAGILFRNKILSGKLPSEIVSEVTNAYNNLSMKCKQTEMRVAVRSSATAEDLPDSSFAGQQETYLNIANISELYKL